MDNTMIDIQQYKKILSNAPLKATHFVINKGSTTYFTQCSESSEYLFQNGYDWDCFGIDEKLDTLTQSLLDIQTIVDQAKEIRQLKKELKLKTIIDKNQQIRNLKEQAKGVLKCFSVINLTKDQQLQILNIQQYLINEATKISTSKKG